ncbi:MAG: sugar ABC transporter permease, partial [Myxococcota bacterium]|nr:sugar ABC transporter permease [Myxococcota bacterium]
MSSGSARLADDERWLGRLFLAPAITYVFALVGAPFALAVFYSFTNVSISSSHATLVGLANFRAAIGDPTFRRAFGNTFLFAFVSQVFVVVLASVLAIALKKDFPGKW